MNDAEKLRLYRQPVNPSEGLEHEERWHMSLVTLPTVLEEERSDF